MKKLLAVVVFCLPAFGQAAYSGRGLYPGSAVYGATVSAGGPLTYSARTDNCVHGYSTNAYTVAPFYNPANETCTGAALTSISGNGSVVTVVTATAPSGATVMIACNSGAYTGGPFTISADATTFTYSSSATGSSSGCVWQAGTGEAGSPLVFQAGASDPLPFLRLDDATNPALVNTSFTSPDFGSYTVFATDQTTNGTRSSWSTNGPPFGLGTANDVLLIVSTTGGWSGYEHVIESRVLAHACSTSNPCIVMSNVRTAAGCIPSATSYTSPNCTQTQMSANPVAFSRNPSDPPNTVYELALPYVFRDTFTGSLTGGFPDGASDSVTRTLYVDFSSDGPGSSIPCSVVATGYMAYWNGIFSVSNDGSLTVAAGGGSPWVSGATAGLDTFIMPIHNQPGIGKFMFQATTPGTASGTEPIWSTSCPVRGNTCTDGTVTWTNIGWVGGQGPGFDLFHFDPHRGCRYSNTRRTKTFNGTNEGPNWPSAGTADPAGQWITDDASTCFKMGGTSCGTGGVVNLPDVGTLHSGGANHNGRYGGFTITSGSTGKNTNYVGGGGDPTQATVGSGSCTPPISWTNFQTWPNMLFVSGNSYTNGKYVASPVDHNYYKLTGTTGTYTTDPSGDSANWAYNSFYCYHYIVDWYSNLIEPELEVGPLFGADGHGATGYGFDYRGGKYISHYLDHPQCQNSTTGTCAGQYVGAPQNPGVFAFTLALPADGHPGTSNEGLNGGQHDLQPIFDPTAQVLGSAGVGRMPSYSSTPGNGGYTSAGYDEILAFSPDGSQTLYRFGSTYNTGSNPVFSVQNATGGVSQNGKLFAWCGDFMDTRGDTGTGSATCVNPAVAMYTASTGGCVALNDYVNTSALGTTVYQITSLGSATQGSCSPLYTEGTVPTWSTCATAGQTCTDTSGIVFTNGGENSCRSDVAVMDVSSAHPAP